MIPNELFEQVELDGAFSGGIVVNESSSGGTIVDGYRFAGTLLTIIKLQLLQSQSAFKLNLER